MHIDCQWSVGFKSKIKYNATVTGRTEAGHKFRSANPPVIIYRDGIIYPEHVKADFSDVTLDEKEALSWDPRRGGVRSGEALSDLSGAARRADREHTIGRGKLWLQVSPLLALWLTIFYITTTRPGSGTDSPGKALCDRKTCMKWKTTSLLQGFLSSRRSAAIARILYGKHPLL